MTTVGVIGCGYWGPNLLRNFVQTREASVKWACDLDEARLKHMQGLYPSIKTTTDCDEVTGDAEVDAVVIAAPASLHHRMAKAALESGKHVFVEKPITMSSKDAKELIAIADKKKLTLMVGHTFLYVSSVAKIKEIIKKGELGEICYISMERLNLGLFQRDINVVWDLAPHDVSLLAYILDEEPVEAAALGRANYLDGVEDVAAVTLKFRSGVTAFLHMSWLDPNKVRKMTIVGKKKMLLYDDIQPTNKIFIYDKGVEKPPHYDTFGEFQFSYRYGDITLPFVKEVEPLRTEALHFIECIKTGARPRSDGAGGLAVVKVLEACDRSLKNGGRLEKV